MLNYTSSCIYTLCTLIYIDDWPWPIGKAKLSQIICSYESKHGIRAHRLTSFFFFSSFPHTQIFKHLPCNGKPEYRNNSFSPSSLPTSSSRSSSCHNQIKSRELPALENPDRPLPPWPASLWILGWFSACSSSNSHRHYCRDLHAST